MIDANLVTTMLDADFGESICRDDAIERYELASLTRRIGNAATTTHVAPSDSQKSAGNYRKGRFWMHGKEFVIETPQGEIRRGKDGRGTPWESPPMPSHYGYIRRTLSEADGDHLDVFIGPRPRSPVVWVIDQHKPDGGFDEHKAMVGFSSEEAAKQAYRDSFHRGWRGLGHVTALTVPQFLRWMDKGDTGKPIHRQERQWYSKAEFDESKHPRARLVSRFNRAMVERYAAQRRLFGGDDTGGSQKRLAFDEDQHPRETSAHGEKRPGEFAPKSVGSESPVATGQHPVTSALDEAFSLKRESATRFVPKNQAGQQADLFGETKLTHSPADESVKKQVESLPGQKSLVPESTDSGEWTEAKASRLKELNDKGGGNRTDAEQDEYGQLSDEDTYEKRRQQAAKDTERWDAMNRDGVQSIKGADPGAFRSGEVNGKKYWYHAKKSWQQNYYSFDKGETWDKSINKAMGLAGDNLHEVGVAFKSKEPWEMTRDEFSQRSAAIPASGGFAARANRKIAGPYHRHLVEQAVAGGKPVPPEVLADYPELSGKSDQPAKAPNEVGGRYAVRPWGKQFVVIDQSNEGMNVLNFRTKREALDYAEKRNRRVEPDSLSRPATYRWLGKEIFKATGGGNWNDQPLKHWEEKARKIAVAPRTIEGVHAAFVNEPWMAQQKPSPAAESQYQKIIDAMNGRHFVDELPKISRHSLTTAFRTCMVERYGHQLGFKFREDDHPRGQPENAGEFRKKDSPAPAAAAKPTVPTAVSATIKPKWLAKGNGVHDAETGVRRGAFQSPETATKVAALWNERDMPKVAGPSTTTGAQFLTGEAKDKHLASLAAKARAKGYIDVSISDVTPTGYGPTSEPEKPEPADLPSLLPPADVELDNPREHPVTTAINKRIMQDFGEKIGGARKDTATPLGTRSKKAVDESRPAWARRYNVSQIAHSSRAWEVGKWAIHDSKDTSHWGQPRQKGELFDTKEAAEAAIPLIAVARNHRVAPTKRNAGDPESYGIVRDITDRKRALVKGGFASHDEAMKYMATHPSEIIEHQFPRYEDYAYLDHVDRRGPEHKKGDVTPEDFQKAFQFRGGEFGNWNSGKDGQTSLNHGYDALHDLADALGLPPRAVALNGDLAIAFGARGTGGLNSARAHYEIGKRVMNLTKMKGAGSLAHEWGHALDHAVSQTGGIDNLALANEHNWKLKLRPEVEAAAKKLRNAMYSAEKSVVAQAADKDRQAKQRDLAKDAIASQFADLENGMVTTPYRKVKPFTPDQQKQWDAAKAKILSGDAGEASYHYSSSDGTKPANARRAMAGKWSYAPLEEMNKLYKQATGRSFHTADSNSTGNRIYWSIKRHAEANNRVSESASGDPKIVRGKSDFLNESVKLDNTRTSNYYSEPHEMFARAFESYVDDKLKEKGRRSDYLVGHGKTDNRHYAAYDMKPFPEGEERKRINGAFDEFFQTLKQEHRSDDKGEHVRLYSRLRMTEQFQRAFVDRYELAPHVFKSIAQQIHGHPGFAGSGLMPLGGRLHGLPGWTGKTGGGGQVEFDPSRHPRAPKGTPTGGKFVSNGSGVGTLESAEKATPTVPAVEPNRWEHLDPKAVEIARRKILGTQPGTKKPRQPLEPIGKLGPAPVFRKTPRWNPDAQDRPLGPAPELPDHLRPKPPEQRAKPERIPKRRPLGKRETAIHDVAKSAAEKYGVSHHDVLAMMRDVHQQRLDEHARVEHIRKFARDRMPSLNARVANAWENKGHDYDSRKGFDTTVEALAGKITGLAGENRWLTSSSPADELWEILKGGAKPKPKMTDEDIAEEAARYVYDNQPQFDTPHQRMRRSMDQAFESALQPAGATNQPGELSRESEYDDPSKGYFSRSLSATLSREFYRRFVAPSAPTSQSTSA